MSLALPEGRLAALIGPNGAGKTTLFALMSGFLVPDSGSVRFAGEEKPDVLMVARGPFFDSDGGRYAYVVDDGLATRRAIRTGATSLTSIEVLEGLKAGDTVIVSATDDFEGAEKVSVR